MSVSEWIDCHFHVFRLPREVAAPVRYLPSYGSSYADWARAAPSHGPRRGVLVQTSFLGTDNSQLLEALRAHPDTLRGVAVIDPRTGREALDALHRAGVRGIRLNLVGASQEDADEACLSERLTDDLIDLGWNVEMHTDPGVLPRLLDQIDARLTVVLDHFGKPSSAAMDDVTFGAVAQRLALGSAPVYVKLSGAYRLGGLDPRLLARFWREAVGVKHLLWGSDWPCTNHEQCADYPRLLAALQEWIGDPAERHQILLDNPLRLYWR